MSEDYKQAWINAVHERNYWREKFEAMLKVMADRLHLNANPPMKLLANAESYEAGRVAGMAESNKAMMQLFTDPENQPTQHGTVTVEYMEKEIAAEREACAEICDKRAREFAELFEKYRNESDGGANMAASQCGIFIRARGVK